MRLNEFRFENDIESQIDEFGILSDKIDKVKMELSELSNRYKEIEGELRPTLEQLQIQNQKSIQTKKYLVTLKRMGYNRDNFKYKESFEKSLTKVNQQTKKVLEKEGLLVRETVTEELTANDLISKAASYEFYSNGATDVLKSFMPSCPRTTLHYSTDF